MHILCYDLKAIYNVHKKISYQYEKAFLINWTNWYWII